LKKGYILVFLAFNLDPFTITFYRTLIAFSILLVYNYSNELPFYALYGFFAVFLFYILYFYTVKISSVSFAVLLLYSAPVYSTILGYALFKEKITKAKILALVIVIFGVFLVANLDHWDANKIATVLGLLSGLTYALYGILAKVAVRDEKPEEALLYTIGFLSPTYLDLHSFQQF